MCVLDRCGGADYDGYVLVDVWAGQVWRSNEGEYLFVVAVPLDIRDDQLLVVYRPTSGGEHRATGVEEFLTGKRRVR
jgi:hypothetical protein